VRTRFPRVAPIVLVLLLSATIGAQAITVRRSGDNVTVRAPAFTFIKGEPLGRLKDGRSVRIDLTLAILPRAGAARVAETQQSFILSYDLWEERFAVSHAGPPGKTTAYLTASAAESWCLDQLLVPINTMGALAKDGPFWIRLEYRIQDGDSASRLAEPADTLQGMIDAFSRRRKAGEWTHSVEAGPFRIQ